MRKLTKRFDIITIILALCTLGWMGVIFALSAQPGEGSAGLSQKIAEAINGFIVWIFAGNPPEFLVSFLSPENIFIRKLGHVSEYAVLSVLMTALLYRLGMSWYLGLSLIFCSIYAASDEFHQMFVPGRGPSFIDVLIDISGSLIGILFLGFSVRKRV